MRKVVSGRRSSSKFRLPHAAKAGSTLVGITEPGASATRATAPGARKRTGSNDCGPRRPSSKGKWRATSLLLVYLAAAAHVAHWIATGRTLTPVEPSEAMQTLGGEALLNAGFVFFVLLILSTLVFGRVFCGWGCHIVALQDACTWLLRKLRITVKPLRSRLLVFVPIGAAFYMFALPTLVRLWLHQGRDPLHTHFTTQSFWDRFPSWPIALLTFAVCGPLIVYLLGNKGFCTYACPYGGIFGLADRLAPGKIRVTDACEGCGHCTATCTSNVRVHEEVRTFGMVVSPGCMKCMDCITVCPNDALYYGFGAPTVAAGKPRAKPAPRTFDFTWPEEIALAASFVVTIPVLSGLYDRVPFLLALGLAAIGSFALLTVARMAYVPNLRFSRYTLRVQGKPTAAGVGFVVLGVAWIAFVAHAGLVQWVTATGTRAADRGAALLAASTGPGRADAVAAVRRGIERLEWSRRLSLVPMARIEAALADAYQSLGESTAADAHYARAVELSPRYAEGRVKLAHSLSRRGQVDAAVAQLEEALKIDPGVSNAAGDLAELQVQHNRAAEAERVVAQALAQRPFDYDLQLTHGVLLAHLGKIDESLAELAQVTKARPNDAEAFIKRGQILAGAMRFDEAMFDLQRGVELAPNDLDAHLLLAKVATAAGRLDVARDQVRAALDLQPYQQTFGMVWAKLLVRMSAADQVIADEEIRSDRPSRFRLMCLYRAAGREADAARVAAESGFGS